MIGVAVLLGVALTLVSFCYHRKTVSIDSPDCLADCYYIQVAHKGLPLSYARDRKVTGGLAGGVHEQSSQLAYANLAADVIIWSAASYGVLWVIKRPKQF